MSVSEPGQNLEDIGESESGENPQDTESKLNAVEPQPAGESESGENPQDTESKLNAVEPQPAGELGHSENQQKTRESESGENLQDTESKQNDSQPQPAGLKNKEGVKSSSQQCEQHEHKGSLTEMERFYKEKLQEARFALKQKEEELKSFKDRVAADLSLSIKTGDTESMNNPVSKTKLTEMYNKLKLLQWPKIKDHLKSNAVSREFTRDLTQKMFKDAAEEMERKKKQIDEVFGLIENSSGLTPQKVKEFRQLTIHSLQMNLYHSRKEDLLQSPFLDDGAQYSQDVMENFRLLASECYWLGCLMALNNPPLQPDWENHVPGMDAWDIFPRNIKSV
ncbi:110 kDa antigen-like isoform X11 [Lates calcarifer]|uniref:110 kDa antigen-like isoform X11 n=1 Tax=Lates calcarifer TaxID=8187 RepID=A0AAJ8DN14_LATCA|nr:110 kDa antigen-like isoform X8 [Lates calcarifer]XP_050924791.1 110 kDa antigen-like isoform X11 [Lates calcarifer]